METFVHKNTVDGGQQCPPLINGEYIPLDWFTEEPPAPEFCINPYAPAGAVALIIAHGGSGKSLLCLKMAVHIVLGLDILDAATNGSKVAYMSLEDSELEFQRRFYRIVNSMPDEALPRSQELAEKLMFINRYGMQTLMANTDKSGNVVETKYPGALVDLLKNEGIKCLIIDTFIRTHSLNENDNAQMGALLVICEKIAVEASCAVILIHHQPKDSSNQRYAARGASAITDNASSVIYLERVDAEKDVDKFDEENIRIAAREGRLVQVVHTKHNYSGEHPVQYFEITKDGVPLERFPTLSNTSGLERRYAELYAWYQEQWGGKPITKTNIDEHYKEMRPKGTSYGKRVYRSALQAAFEAGYAVKTAPPTDASKNPKAEYYALSSLDLR